MSFKHLGMVKDGAEDTTSDKVKEWSVRRKIIHVKKNVVKPN